MQTTPRPSLTVDDIFDGIFASQAVIARLHARQERELQEDFRCGCLDGCIRCDGTGVIER